MTATRTQEEGDQTNKDMHAELIFEIATNLTKDYVYAHLKNPSQTYSLTIFYVLKLGKQQYTQTAHMQHQDNANNIKSVHFFVLFLFFNSEDQLLMASNHGAD